MKHRYLITLTLPVAALFGGLAGAQAAVGRTLRDLGIETFPTSHLTAAVPLVLTVSKELDASHRARVIAAIEAEYSRVGAAVSDFQYQGGDDFTPEEAPIVANMNTATFVDEREQQASGGMSATGVSNVERYGQILAGQVTEQEMSAELQNPAPGNPLWTGEPVSPAPLVTDDDFKRAAEAGKPADEEPIEPSPTESKAVGLSETVGSPTPAGTPAQ